MKAIRTIEMLEEIDLNKYKVFKNQDGEIAKYENGIVKHYRGDNNFAKLGINLSDKWEEIRKEAIFIGAYKDCQQNGNSYVSEHGVIMFRSGCEIFINSGESTNNKYENKIDNIIWYRE